MRTTIAVVSTAGALLFGGAAVANADIAAAPVSTTVAQDDHGTTTDNGDSGKWGLAGLLGLLGLLGLRHRHAPQDDHAGVGARTHTAPTSGAKAAASHSTGGSTQASAGPTGTAVSEPTAPYTPQTYPGTTPPPPTV